MLYVYVYLSIILSMKTIKSSQKGFWTDTERTNKYFVLNGLICWALGKQKYAANPLVSLEMARLLLYDPCRAKLPITSFLFWASISASLCCSSSCNICFSMIFLASSTRRFTSASISSFRFSNSSSTRFATSSSTRRATSSSINFSSSSFCFLKGHRNPSWVWR